VEQGGLILNYPMGTQPRAEYFPSRNRILSSLFGDGCYESGSMITEHTATEPNSEDFTVPASIFLTQSFGLFSLIRDNATLVRRTEDILKALNRTIPGAQRTFGRYMPPESPKERAVIEVPTHEPRHVDEFVRNSYLADSVVDQTCTMLELKGRTRDVGGMQYVRLREDLTNYNIESVASVPGIAGE